VPSGPTIRFSDLSSTLHPATGHRADRLFLFAFEKIPSIPWREYEWLQILLLELSTYHRRRSRRTHLVTASLNGSMVTGHR